MRDGVGDFDFSVTPEGEYLGLGPGLVVVARCSVVEGVTVCPGAVTVSEEAAVVVVVLVVVLVVV